ncbi:MAG: hypothetical protein COB02_14445 [Candidatus Cloacimonadota bacterium]|nr:MAG: hypothetical protein COB02_14445 [Candidatus Cloacimonadota bacterium]
MTAENRFRILTFLAKGGYGSIFVANDSLDNKIKVIKVYDQCENLDLSKLDIQQERLKKIEFEGILKPNEWIKSSPRIAVFTFLKGGNLFQKIKKEGPLSFDTIGVYLAQLVRILDYLHLNKIVHRDIKPDNIFIEKDTIYLADLDFCHFSRGLFKDLKLTKEYCQRGSSLFMSPQHLKGKRPNHFMDQYSLATTVYYFLSTKYPFGNDISKRFNVSNYQMINSLTRHQNYCLIKALNPKESNRYSSVVEFYQDLYLR